MRFVRSADDPVRSALVVSWVTVVWSTGMGVASAAVGVITHSLSLAGLGVTVLIDVGSSLVLIWRFLHERRGGQMVDRAEQLAHRAASAALGVLALLLVVQAGRNLLAHATPHVSAPAAVLGAVSLVVLPCLARWKYRVAAVVASRALRADAHITAVGAGIAGVTLAGLVLVGVWEWWWADAVAALVLAAVAGWQSWEGLHGVRASSRGRAGHSL